MKLITKKGTTSRIIHVFISDSSSTTGDGLTGMLYNSTGLTSYYIREGYASVTAITLADATVGTYTSGGFKEVDATNMPGIYELHLPDACFAAGADQVVIFLKGAANMVPLPIEIQLRDNTEKDVKDVVDVILVDTGTTLENHLVDIKGTGFVKDTDSLPQCLTAVGFSAPNEYDAAIAALQTDLDDPTQYKADVSTLATTTALSTAQADLDTITGSDGVVLAMQQLNYAPNTVIPDAMGTAAGLHATTDGKIDAVQTDTTAIKAKTDNLPSGMAKNVAVPKFDVFMVLSSDHVTGATGKTVTSTISKDGGAFTALTNSITEVDAGVYTIAGGLTQEERNADVSTLKFSADGCDDRIITIISS